MPDFDPTNPEHREHARAALTDPYSWGDLASIAAGLGCAPTKEAVAAAMVAYDPEVCATARGNWIQTFTGRRFFPMSPRSDEVNSLDIAHALSLICRYGGHTSRFYSVAEHCVLMSRAVAPEYALWALLHDATEAYVGDMVRPLKLHMPTYVDIEDAVMIAIAERYGLSSPVIPAEVKDADRRILLDERDRLLRRPPADWDVEDLEPLGVHVAGWSPDVAEQQYLLRLNELLGGAR